MNDTSIPESTHYLFTFPNNNDFEQTTWCDVLPMVVIHILLGRCWLFYQRPKHDNYQNTYNLVQNGFKILYLISLFPN